MKTILRFLGFIIIPVEYFETMQLEAKDSYEAMKRKGMPERDIGYFNGIADHASKTASKFLA
jgi:hypothetical protein